MLLRSRCAVDGLTHFITLASEIFIQLQYEYDSLSFPGVGFERLRGPSSLSSVISTRCF